MEHLFLLVVFHQSSIDCQFHQFDRLKQYARSAVTLQNELYFMHYSRFKPHTSSEICNTLTSS